MEGLVDYGVDSDRESNDSPNPENSTISRNKRTEPNIVPDANKRDSSSNKGSKSSKSGHSKEVHKSSSSNLKTHKTSEKHHKHHKRSRSRERDSRSKRRSRSRERKEHHHHHDERKKKRRSKSRSRSPRSRSRSSSSSRRDRKKPARRTRSQERREKKAATIARMGLDVTNVAASLAMSASESTVVADSSNNSKQNLSTTTTSTSTTTSAAVHAAAQQVLQNRVAQAEQVTGVALPSFYNPAAVNPMKYAQQIQKRKLLWSNKEKNEPPATSTAKLWEATAFTQDQDGKMTAKFKRLMGIKHDPSEGAGPSVAEVSASAPGADEVLKKQQELFASLDQQYQVARATTHTQRGLGLGFSSNPSTYPR